ncbi:hypothetical protein [Chitinophaga nivalis]|uniref:ABM domain-containing protein n=1 Tax=Chitinophaga nivalis TaxID=2991709 RepID=A0ABT3IRY0_9BACT|nr:hypothetical protein [Chitinophaga nivalis]MCW3463563.1 hypothetical protein [Chitinophaga nivalis]MCW3486747.1 hypothetical protein [Chitinophaga nivalis]
MGVVVMVAYQPKSGQEELLNQLVSAHVPILRGEGLATERTPLILRAKDGTLIEIFEWKSADSIVAARDNDIVKELWDKFQTACNYIAPAHVPEFQEIFSSFEPVNW